MVPFRGFIGLPLYRLRKNGNKCTLMAVQKTNEKGGKIYETKVFCAEAEDAQESGSDAE